MKKISSIIFILYFLLILSFPMGVILRFTPMQNVNIYPQDLFAGAIFITTILFLVKNKNYYRNNLLISIAIFNLIAVLSLLLNIFTLSSYEFLVAFSYLLRFNVYASLLFMNIFGLEKSKKTILKRAFIFSTILFIILGYIQFIFYNNLRNLYYLGWDEHVHRMFTTFLDPNYSGLLFSLLLIYAIGRLLSQKFTFNRYFILNSLFAFIAFGALLLTYSRTGIIAVAVGLIFLLIRFRKIKELLILIVIFFTGLILVSDFEVENMNPLRIASSNARIESFDRAFDIFKSSPVYGIGFNAYRYAQIDKNYVDYEQTKINNADAGTDNSFMFVLATMGIVGFLSYLNFWKQIFVKIKSRNDRKTSDLAKSIVIALFSGSIFINGLFYIPLMLWIYLYLSIFVFKED